VNWDAIEFDLGEIFAEKRDLDMNGKASNAYFVLKDADFETVRSKCPRFDSWLRRWENWGMKA